MRLEDALLFGGGEAGVERDDLDLPQLLGEVFLCLADLSLARQKAEDVARRFPEQGAGRPFDSLRNIEDWRVRIVGVAERLIPDLDGVSAARHLDDGCGPPGGVGEVSGELLGVDRGRGDDHVKVVAPFDESAQVAEQEVDVERPLVGFVDDDRVVPTEIRVALEFGEEDAVGHRLHQRAVADFVGETHRVADEVTDFGTEFVRHPSGDRAGRKAPRLGVADHGVDASPEFETELRYLGRLAGSGFSGDHHDLVVPDRVEEFPAPLDDRQLVRVGDLGHAGAALLHEISTHGVNGRQE